MIYVDPTETIEKLRSMKAKRILLLFAIHLAVKNCGMTCNEAINAATINAAASLGLLDRMGTIEPGRNIKEMRASVNP